jgi:hypothetical protein
MTLQHKDVVTDTRGLKTYSLGLCILEEGAKVLLIAYYSEEALFISFPLEHASVPTVVSGLGI